MIITWSRNGFGRLIAGIVNVHVFTGSGSGSPTPPTTGGIEMKIVVDLFSGETVKLTPSVGGIGGTGVM